MPEMGILSCLPFMATVGGKAQLNTSRIIEGLIIAAVAGAVAGYISVKELRVEVQSLKNSVTKIERTQEKLSDKMDRAQEKLFEDLYKPRVEESKKRR